jgi:predicted outer membrane protein
MRLRTSWASLIAIVSCAGMASAIGCGGDDNSTAGAADAGTDATTSDAAALDGATRDAAPLDSGLADATDARSADAADGGDGGVPYETLADDQIVQVLHASNVGEVAEGTLAEASAVTPVIVDLATMFVQMHGMADTQLLATASDAGLTAASSNTSTTMQTQAAADEAALGAKSGVAFDELYYAIQLRTHQTVLTVIDELLLPQVQSAELKTQVQAAQTMVAMHLQELQAIEQGDAGTFDAGDAGDGGDGGDGGSP